MVQTTDTDGWTMLRLRRTNNETVFCPSDVKRSGVSGLVVSHVRSRLATFIFNQIVVVFLKKIVKKTCKKTDVEKI